MVKQELKCKLFDIGSYDYCEDFLWLRKQIWRMRVWFLWPLWKIFSLHTLPFEPTFSRNIGCFDCLEFNCFHLFTLWCFKSFIWKCTHDAQNCTLTVLSCVPAVFNQGRHAWILTRKCSLIESAEAVFNQPQMAQYEFILSNQRQQLLQNCNSTMCNSQSWIW